MYEARHRMGNVERSEEMRGNGRVDEFHGRRQRRLKKRTELVYTPRPVSYTCAAKKLDMEGARHQTGDWSDRDCDENLESRFSSSSKTDRFEREENGPLVRSSFLRSLRSSDDASVLRSEDGKTAHVSRRRQRIRGQEAYREHSETPVTSQDASGSTLFPSTERTGSKYLHHKRQLSHHHDERMSAVKTLSFTMTPTPASQLLSCDLSVKVKQQSELMETEEGEKGYGEPYPLDHSSSHGLIDMSTTSAQSDLSMSCLTLPSVIDFDSPVESKETGGAIRTVQKHSAQESRVNVIDLPPMNDIETPRFTTKFQPDYLSACSTALKTTTPLSDIGDKHSHAAPQNFVPRKLSFSKLNRTRLETPPAHTLNSSFFSEDIDSQPRCPGTPIRKSLIDSSPTPDAKGSNSIMMRKTRNRLSRQSSLGTTKVLVTLDSAESTRNAKRKCRNQLTPVLGNHSFVFKKILGKGESSEVYEVQDQSAAGMHRFAIKKAKQQFRSRRDRAKYLQEVEVYKELAEHGACENIVRYYSAWQEGGFFYCQMELCEAGSLKDILSLYKQGLVLDAIYNCIQDISAGLHHIHRSGLVHLDLKPANIFVCQTGLIKIGDFGRSCHIGANSSEAPEGDVVYAAIETIQDSPRLPTADLFSFGLIILELVTTLPLPSEGADWQGLRCERIPQALNEKLGSSELRECIQSLLRAQPEKRLSASTVLKQVRTKQFDADIWLRSYISPLLSQH